MTAASDEGTTPDRVSAEKETHIKTGDKDVNQNADL